MMAFGLFVLWFGFIPFNAGSGVSVLGWMVSPVASLELDRECFTSRCAV